MGVDHKGVVDRTIDRGRTVFSHIRLVDGLFGMYHSAESVFELDGRYAAEGASSGRPESPSSTLEEAAKAQGLLVVDTSSRAIWCAEMESEAIAAKLRVAEDDDEDYSMDFEYIEGPIRVAINGAVWVFQDRDDRFVPIDRYEQESDQDVARRIVSRGRIVFTHFWESDGFGMSDSTSVRKFRGRYAVCSDSGSRPKGPFDDLESAAQSEYLFLVSSASSSIWSNEMTEKEIAAKLSCDYSWDHDEESGRSPIDIEVNGRVYRYQKRKGQFGVRRR